MQCKGTNKYNGERCKVPAIPGGKYCVHHRRGGLGKNSAAPQTKRVPEVQPINPTVALLAGLSAIVRREVRVALKELLS